MQNHARSSNWYHVLAFLSLAAGLGLACGVALGSIALLLAAPAYGAETQESALILRPSERSADNGRAIQAQRLSTDVAFQVVGPVVRARVVEAFLNPAEVRYEGFYLFPLPENAVVERLQLRIGARLSESEAPEALGAKLFAVKVADVGPGEAVVVELEYQQPLPHDGNRFSSRFLIEALRHVQTGPL